MPPASRPEPPTLAAVLAATAWRVLIVYCAFRGYSATGGFTLYGLSQLASVAAGIGYAAVIVADLAAAATRRPEPPTAWLRGLLAVTLLLVMVTWFTVMEGDVDATWSRYEHLLTPLAVLADWLCVGRRQALARWWYPLTWAAGPLAYLVAYLGAGQDLYVFLDPDRDGFTANIAGFTALVIATGYLLLGAARLRRAVSPHGPG